MFPFLVMCQYLCSFTGAAPMLQSSHIHLFMTLKNQQKNQRNSQRQSLPVLKGPDVVWKGL